MLSKVGAEAEARVERLQLLKTRPACASPELLSQKMLTAISTALASPSAVALGPAPAAAVTPGPASVPSSLSLLMSPFDSTPPPQPQPQPQPAAELLLRASPARSSSKRVTAPPSSPGLGVRSSHATRHATRPAHALPALS